MRFKNILLIGLTATSFGLTSCFKDFLDQPPRSFLAPENVFNDEKGFETAVIACYGNLHALYVGKQTIVMREFGTDEVINFDMWDMYGQLCQYTFSSGHGFFSDFYRVMYDGVKRCNAVIEKAPANIPEKMRLQAVAQAKFLRALHYYNLVAYWGGVPKQVKSAVSLNDLKSPKVSADEIYELIVQDLKDAEEHLPDTWEGADKGKATVWAARALTAKVYLQWKKWDKAIEYCDKFIKNPANKFRLYDNYADVFNQFKKNEEVENIFEIQFKHSGAWNEQGSILSNFWGSREIGAENGGGWSGFGPSEYIYKSYEPNDNRFAVSFITEGTNSAGQHVTFRPHAYKFNDKVNHVIEDDDLNFTLLRYADILLMKSEALNASGAAGTEKYDYLNLVRKRAGLGPITAGSHTQDQFLDILMTERLHEFCFEQQRKADLIRTGKLVDYMRDRMGVTVRPHHYLMPFPDDALKADNLLVQNPGY